MSGGPSLCAPYGCSRLSRQEGDRKKPPLDQAVFAVCSTNLGIRTDQNVMAVPDDAVSTLAGVSTVYVIEDGKARQQVVSLGAHEAKRWEIVDGLKGTETAVKKTTKDRCLNNRGHGGRRGMGHTWRATS